MPVRSIITSPKASNTIRMFRLNFCQVCPHYNRHTKSCGQLWYGGRAQSMLPVPGGGMAIHTVELCGCKVGKKCKYKDERCPAGKW